MNITRIENRETCLRVVVDDTYYIYLFPEGLKLYEHVDYKVKLEEEEKLKLAAYIKTELRNIAQKKYEIDHSATKKWQEKDDKIYKRYQQRQEAFKEERVKKEKEEKERRKLEGKDTNRKIPYRQCGFCGKCVTCKKSPYTIEDYERNKRKTDKLSKHESYLKKKNKKTQ